jgi:hypothetical protein
MAEASRFFRSEDGDRVYSAEEFAEYFRSIIRDGVTYDDEEGLKIIANGSNMTLTVMTGGAFVQGYQFFLYDPKDIDIDTEGAGQNRIDLIILKVDRLGDRKLSLEIKKGTPASNPSPPELIKDIEDSGIYEYALAEVGVTGGQSYLEQGDIITRANKAKILNNKYRQIFISTDEPVASEGEDGDIWIKYEP